MLNSVLLKKVEASNNILLKKIKASTDVSLKKIEASTAMSSRGPGSSDPKSKLSDFKADQFGYTYHLHYNSRPLC